MRKKVYDFIFLFGIAGVIIVLDQWTKALVRAKLSLGEHWVPWDWLEPYARIVYWKNTGAAFGIGKDLGLVFVLLAIFVVILIVYYFPHIPRDDWSLRIAMGLQLGGAVGNLISRILDGFVTDFISVGSFPVFNVADSSISIGAAILVIGMWIQENKEKKQKAEETVGTDLESVSVNEEKTGE